MTATDSERPQTSARSADARSADRFALLSFVTAGLTYALIVFGGIVRITGSGMGCGDDWPLCHGQLIPPLDFATLIEYGHRLAAALVSVFVFGVALYALRQRRTVGIADRGIVGLAMASLVLLVVQVLVGAVTVWLELPTGTVVLHLIVASALLATLLAGGLRAWGWSIPSSRPWPSATYPRWALASAGLGFLLLVFGGLVANTGAAPLCQGFPLCNGQVIPEGGALVQLHWAHRLLAFAFLGVVAAGVTVTLRQRAPAAVAGPAAIALALAITQTAVAAALVLLQLPDSLRAVHLAVGVALWAALVVWSSLAVLHVVPHTVAEAVSDAASRAILEGRT